LLLCCGGLTTITAVLGSLDPSHTAAVNATPPAPSATVEATDEPSATEAPSPTAEPTPVVETRRVTETQPISFQTRRVNDPSFAAGTTKVQTSGMAGVKTLTYEVTFTNGMETSRRLQGAVVTKAPVTRVIAVGTKPAQQCDPNYSGACVPIASDVDCAGGTGNGPAYVEGPVRIIGTDIYRLDSDGDRVGCED
jgi:hypothetical protein